MQVALSMVILLPMFHAGRLKISFIVTCATALRSFQQFYLCPLLNKDVLISDFLPDFRDWNNAECSESIGIMVTLCFSASRITISPANTNVSLLARPIVVPFLIASRVGINPAEPTRELIKRSLSRVAIVLSPSSP